MTNNKRESNVSKKGVHAKESVKVAITCLKYDIGKLQNPPVLHQPMKRTVDTDSQLWLRLCSGHLPVCATSPETGIAPHLDGRMDFNPPFRAGIGDPSAHIFGGISGKRAASESGTL
jgi:hypothetical protein